MDYFKLLCWIFCIWDVLILILMCFALAAVKDILKLLKMINQRHSAEVSLQWDTYQEIRQVVLAIEGKEE